MDLFQSTTAHLTTVITAQSVISDVIDHQRLAVGGATCGIVEGDIKPDCM